MVLLDTVLHIEWDHPSKKEKKKLSPEGCDARWDTPVMWWGRNLAIGFLDKINLFFFFYTVCVYVFCGECGCICIISICVANIQLWLLWLNRAIIINADRPLWTIWPISVWLSSEWPRISVCDYRLTAINGNVWPYQCMSGNQSMYVSMY